MSFKVMSMLSLFFLVPMLLFVSDLSFLTAIHNELDAVGLSAGYRISLEGSINEDIISFVKEECGADIHYIGGNESPKFGEAVVFELSKDYFPFIIASDRMTVTVRRTAVIGYLGS